jgi:hypothetical protein
LVVFACVVILGITLGLIPLYRSPNVSLVTKKYRLNNALITQITDGNLNTALIKLESQRTPEDINIVEKFLNETGLQVNISTIQIM